MRRYKQQIKRAVADMIGERSITDMEHGGDVSIPRHDISEPSFGHGDGGDREFILPGNREYVPGDRIARPESDGGSGAGDPGKGESVDAFTFTLSRDEFLSLFFDDLELPHLVRTHVGDVEKTRSLRSGYSLDGAPSNLAIIRSLKAGIGRRIALRAPYRQELTELEEQLRLALVEGRGSVMIAHLRSQIEQVQRKIDRIPFIAPLDLRYRNRVVVPAPIARAVMFCLMDVSASMDETKKDLAKRFFTLLYMFLTRKYRQVEVVFIRHTDTAEEVDEQTFFHDQKSGGTVVLSALQLTHEIILGRYAATGWNVYAAQASDGDAFGSDTTESAAFLENALLPQTRYFAYIEIPDHANANPSRLWHKYQRTTSSNFAMRRVSQRRDIYPVFRELFKKSES